jgi:hypothetical protein
LEEGGDLDRFSSLTKLIFLGDPCEGEKKYSCSIAIREKVLKKTVGGLIKRNGVEINKERLPLRF